MCNISLHDPFNRTWVLGITESGNLTTDLVPNNSTVNPNPILSNGSNYFTLSVTTGGLLQTTPTSSSPLATALIDLDDVDGNPYQLTLDTTGVITVTSGGNGGADQIPTIPDVNRIVIPLPGLIAYSAGGASVVCLSDYSLWCCALQKFIHPEDTNIYVYLDE